MKLLIADSDADLVEMLTSWLRTRGYQVKYALSAERIRAEWIEHEPDLVIVDTKLKGVDMLGLCRDLRDAHDALVLVLAAEQDADTQIRCLESGADACLVKPFLPSQLLAHIHALSRRVRRTLMRNPASILSVGPIRVNAVRHEVSVDGVVSRLTPTESKLLHLLAVNANDVCTLEMIVAHVWGYGEQSDTALVKAHIRHLREKIERDPSRPRYLTTVAGSGYMLVRQPDEAATDTVSVAIADADVPGEQSDNRKGVPGTGREPASITEWWAVPGYGHSPKRHHAEANAPPESTLQAGR